MEKCAVKRMPECVREEFASIRSDLRRRLGSTASVEVANRLLVDQVPALIVSRSQVLLDTLLNFLMKDALATLAEAPTEIQNEFHAQNFRKQIRDAFTLDAATLQFSFDRRVLAGGLASGGALLTGAVVGFVLGEVVAAVITGFLTLVTAALAYRTAYAASSNLARRQVEITIEGYLNQSESQVSSWLGEIERAFSDAFDKFCRKENISPRIPT